MTSIDPGLIPIFILYLFILAIIFTIKIIFLKSHTKNKIITALFTLYILLLVKVVICPIKFFRQENQQIFQTLHINFSSYFQLIPFKTIIDAFEKGIWIIQVLGNIILLFPLPFFLDLLSKKQKSNTFFLVTGFLVCISIEGMQLLIDIIFIIRSHVFDIDDIILNFLGIILGIFLLRKIQSLKIYTRIKEIIR